MAITELRQLMRGVTSITQKHEFTLRKPVNQHRHQLTGQMRGCFMPVFFGVVKLLRTVQCHQYRQSPTPRGKRELYGDSQYDPAVAPAKDHVLMGRTHRVMMAALAVNTLTAMLGGGVVHRDQNRFVGWDLTQDRSRQNLAQRPQRPNGARENPVVGAGMPFDQASHRPEYPSDGSSAHCQDSPDCQWKNSLESWLSKCYRKLEEKLFCCRWNSKHNRLLSELIIFNNNKHRQESISCANVFFLHHLTA